MFFLELNGYRFNADEDAAAQAAIDLVAVTIDETGYFRAILANAKRASESVNDPPCTRLSAIFTVLPERRH